VAMGVDIGASEAPVEPVLRQTAAAAPEAAVEPAPVVDEVLAAEMGAPAEAEARTEAALDAVEDEQAST
jgi:small subunit ribosomal protein S2